MAARTRTARIAVVALSIVSATLAAHAAGAGANSRSARGARPAAVAKRTVSARTSVQFPMPAPGDTAIQTVKLPAGAWSVIAKAVAVNFSGVDFVRCDLYDLTHNVSLDGSTAQVGTGINSAGPITNIATIVVPAATTVQVQHRCGHDTSAGNSAYIDPDASLVAFQTLDGSAAGQSLVRTSAAVPLTATDANVGTLSLPAGDWALGFKFTGVTFSGSTVVVCSLGAARGFDGGAAVTVGPTTAAATGGYFSYVSGGQTVNLTCRFNGASGAYIDPGTVLWARKAKASTAVEGGCAAYLVNAKTDLIAMVRQGAQCTISGGGNTTLSSASVGQGTWVALGGEGDVSTTNASADFLRCALTKDGSHLDTTATWETQFNQVGVMLVGTIKLASPGNFHETCTRDVASAQSTSYEGSLVLIKV